MTTLNSKQQHSYSKFLQLSRFLRKSKHIHSKVAPFYNEVTTFLHHLETIPAQATIKATKGMSITSQKREAKKEIARKAAGICCRVTAYAITTGNTKLTGKVNFTYTNIYTTTDAFLQFRIASIVNAITPLLNNETFKPYGIRKEHLTSVTNKTKQFTGSISCAKFLNRNSDYASRTITATLNKIKESITQMERLLILFTETHPTFVESFRQAMATEQKSKHSSNAVEGMIKDSSTGQPLQNVTITAESNKKTGITNASGFYHLKGLKRGTQNFIITADGYTPQTITATIIRGKTITLNIVMNAKAFSGGNAEVA